MRNWVAFFSQTGSEIVEVSKKLEIVPSVVFTDRKDLQGVDTNIFNFEIVQIKNFSVENYRDFLLRDDFITLNGYLRVIPKQICYEYEIYNGHPGLITDYPELKGKNPQEKAFKLKLEESGCIIHKVTPEIDAGEVLKLKRVSIKNLSINEIYRVLHQASIDLWVEFLKEKL